MLGANDQTHPPGASWDTAADGSPAASGTSLGPRAGVIAIAAVNFVTGSALLIIALLYLVGLLTYPGGANDPYRGITLLVEGGLSVGVLLLGALFILAAVGLSMRHKWSLHLASVTSILIHLIGLLTLCGLAT